jgi:hypothetical protein
VSNQKIKNIEKHLRKNKSKYSDDPDADIVTGYFVPVVPKISRKFKTRYRETGIYGVDEMLGILNCKLFSSDQMDPSKDYFSFLRSCHEDVKEIFDQGGNPPINSNFFQYKD